MGGSDDDSSEGADEEWRDYPIWLQAAVRDESEEKTVRVLDGDDCGEAPKNNRVRVKVIEMPDTLEHAVGVARQRHRLEENSVVLVTADPNVQPYIGLITKLWLDVDAPFEERGGVKWYRPGNLWFERPPSTRSAAPWPTSPQWAAACCRSHARRRASSSACQTRGASGRLCSATTARGRTATASAASPSFTQRRCTGWARARSSQRGS
ncbi:MAG: hypothetical protein J3K34DRAFT_93394 [Monoraphidium minutum]|nr:MAG: hypothetical protein J3K34DRAFT_93394 [Monoraphidium minutum]